LSVFSRVQVRLLDRGRPTEGEDIQSVERTTNDEWCLRRKDSNNQREEGRRMFAL